MTSPTAEAGLKGMALVTVMRRTPICARVLFPALFGIGLKITSYDSPMVVFSKSKLWWTSLFVLPLSKAKAEW